MWLDILNLDHWQQPRRQRLAARYQANFSWISFAVGKKVCNHSHNWVDRIGIYWTQNDLREEVILPMNHSVNTSFMLTAKITASVESLPSERGERNYRRSILRAIAAWERGMISAAPPGL